MRTDKHALAPQGIDGGQPGGTGSCVINPGGEDERSLPSRFGDQWLKSGDVLRVERPGGGGVGAACERSPQDIVEDVRQGYVSVERARSDYGVVLRANGGQVTLDPDATRICVLSLMNRNHRMFTRIGGETVKTENELLKRITARPDVLGTGVQQDFNNRNVATQRCIMKQRY